MTTIKGWKRGVRSISVTRWPDGTWTRADVRLDLAQSMTTEQVARLLETTPEELTKRADQETRR